MAKMFYTLEEAAQKLGKSTDEVQKMATSGQIQEFRDRDKLMFKVEQINLLAGGGDDEIGHVGDSGDSGVIGLADSAENRALNEQSKEESVLGLMDSKESTGISIFDADDMEKADPSAQTQVSDSLTAPGFNLDAAQSGSGLLDLTKEADDTSLGAVLDDIYPGGEEEPAAGASGGASGLFASTGPAAELTAPIAGAGILGGVIERYDGAWSGIGIGLSIGAMATLIMSALVLFTAVSDGFTSASGIAVALGGNLWMYVGIFGGFTLIAAIIGWFVGKTFQ